MIRRGRQPKRFLATILFTDIVGSTDLAAKIGDTMWRHLVASHNAQVRAQLKRFGGREVDTAGDGFLCSFEQPAQAVRAADAILTDVARLGVQLRAGIHTGESEMLGRKIGGIAVHIAARVIAAAEPGQVLVSGTVRDLVAGSRLEFADQGTHQLKGVPGEWHLYSLIRDAPAVIDAGKVPSVEGPATPRQISRRTAVAGLALGGGALVLAGGLVAMLLGRQPPVAPAVPAPNTVVTIDAVSNTVVAVHAVPAGPVAIAFDPSAARLWVASLDAGVVTDFAVSGTQAANRTTGRVGRPTDVSIGGGIVWVADSYDKTLTLLDASQGEPRRTVENVMARQIAYGMGSIWATDDIADRLLRIDGQSGDVAQTADLGAEAYPRGIAFGLGSAWIGNAGLSTVARVDGSTATVAQAGIALRAVPGAIVAGVDSVWIAGPQDDVVLRLDPNTNSVSKTITVGATPVSIALDGNTIWVGCAGSREVWHLDQDGSVLAKVDVRGVPSDLAVGDGRVYVTVRSP
jgi:class 3 adenylate cyclase/streptogramin lyase